MTSPSLSRARDELAFKRPAILHQDGRDAAHDFRKERRALLDQRHRDIERDQCRDHDDRVGQRIILAEQGALHGAADDQEQNEFEGRQLAERAAAGEADHDPEQEIDDRGLNDAVHECMRPLSDKPTTGNVSEPRGVPISIGT